MTIKKFFYPLWIIAYILIGGVIVIFYIICSVIAFVGIAFEILVNKLDNALDRLIDVTRWFKK